MSAPRARRRRKAARTCAAIAVITLVGACGTAGSPGRTQTPGTPASSGATAPSTTWSTGAPSWATTAPASTSVTAHSPSALDQIAAFVSRAQTTDAALRDVAAQVNAGVTAQTITVGPAAINAVGAIEPHLLVATLPGGLPDAVQKAALDVYADLMSRRDALREVQHYEGLYPLARTSAYARELMQCLGNGAPAAARFGPDMAELRAVAESSPATPLAAASSRAAAEVAIRVAVIDESNHGCGACGGGINTPPHLWTITWKHTETSPDQVWDGQVATLLFRATYTADSGWAVYFNVC